MPRSTPPGALESPDDAEWLTIDSGWSTVPPGPADAASRKGKEPQRARKKKSRAQGTLLGVAPPHSPAPGAPKGRSPIIVHSGVARGDATAALTDAAHPPSAQHATSAPGIVEAPHIRAESSPAEAVAVVIPPKAQRRPPALPTMPLPAESERKAVRAAEQPSGTHNVSADPVNALGLHLAVGVVAARPQADVRSLGEAMTGRVQFAGAQLPLWLLMAPLFGLVLAAIAALAVMGPSRMRQARSAERPSAGPDAPITGKQGFRPGTRPTSDITALQSRPPESLSTEEVLLVAGVVVESDRSAARLARERLARDPSAIKDKVTLAELRKFALTPGTSDDALAAVAALRGPASANLLYEIWTAMPGHPEGFDLARALLYSRDVRREASDALAVALDLTVARGCDANRELLPRAGSFGDLRSLPLLTRLKSKRGCGRHEKQDCYSCLRRSSALDAAIAAVKRRPAPNLFDTP